MYILSIGSNQGDRVQHLKNTIDTLNTVGTVFKLSSIYETPSWGYDGNDYLNMCISWKPTKGNISELDTLDILQNIEHDLGRRRTEVQYTDRVIDIDIVSKENSIVKHQRLEIPHSKMHQRKFVLIPLAEIYPHFFHPILEKSVKELIETCVDTDEITIYGTL